MPVRSPLTTGQPPTTRPRAAHARVALAALAITAVVVPVSSASAAYSHIEGSGSTWSQVIVDQWIADVNPKGIDVTYNGSGSSQGRRDFANSVVDFAISDTPYQGTDEYGNADSSNGRDFAYVPIVAGGTAFTYHLESSGELVRDIRLSGETIAKIFTNQITYWDDAAIVADNNGRTLPHTPITPVVRSDGAGTTAQLTTWLDMMYPSIWRNYFGSGGTTSYYPATGAMIAAAGSDQAMYTVLSAAGNGTIAYVEYSYPLNHDYPVVKVLNAAGYYVEPTPYNVAVALTAADTVTDAASPLYRTQVLDDVYTNPDPRAYPLSSYSYMIIPTGALDMRMTTNKRQSLVDLIGHALCDGQATAGPYGYSPLPLNLVQAGFEAAAELRTADPDVDVSGLDAATCTNPTFVADDPSRNWLAEIAPMPRQCDAVGEGPCFGPASDGSGVVVTASVPESTVGALTLSIATPATMALTGWRDVAGEVRAEGGLPIVSVTDTRADSSLSLWELNAQASSFASPAGSFGAEYLGWEPGTPSIERADASPLMVQGGPAAYSRLADADSTGLAGSALLEEAVVAGRGLTRISAGLLLHAPASLSPGTYTATITLTLVSG